MSTLKNLSDGQKYDILKNLSNREWSATLNDYFDNGEKDVNFNINGSPNRQPLDFDLLPNTLKFDLIRKDVNTLYTYTVVDPYILQILFDASCNINDLDIDVSYETLMIALGGLSSNRIYYVLSYCKIVDFLENNYTDTTYKEDIKSLLYRTIDYNVHNDEILLHLNTLYPLFENYTELKKFLKRAVVNVEPTYIRIFINTLSTNDRLIKQYIKIQNHYNCNILFN